MCPNWLPAFLPPLFNLFLVGQSSGRQTASDLGRLRKQPKEEGKPNKIDEVPIGDRQGQRIGAVKENNAPISLARRREALIGLQVLEAVFTTRLVC